MVSTIISKRRYKRSRQREKILETLRATKAHPTAYWIYDTLKPYLPELSLGTVYRNLGILHDQGLIQILRSGSGLDRFDADTSQHYHFICTACGAVSDVDIPPFEGLEEKVAGKLGRVVTGHRLDFYGLCEKCAAEVNY